MACAPSEDSDQPGHPPSLIRVFAVRLFVEHHVVATYNLLSLQIINHFSFISMLILQSQLNDIVLQFKQFDQSL